MDKLDAVARDTPDIREQRRMDVVRRYDILDTPPDGAFDRITALAARLFQVPIAIISIVDTDRIWFKSHHGVDAEQTARAEGLCASAILHDAPWVVSDAKTDPRSMANPLVATEAGMRFYVGIPLRTHDGYNLGTLCVLDTRPHAVTPEQVAHLDDLASVVMDQLELRLSARRAIEAKDAALSHSLMMAQEIDHRVMNSLQFIATLLEVQSQHHGNTDAGREIARAAGRVNAIANVHQHINLDDDFEDADAVRYLGRLCSYLAGISGMTRKQIVVEGLDVRLGTERLVPVGLVVNELVTNAIKYGATAICVALEEENGLCVLAVTDNGPGLPEQFDMAASNKLGMKVVTSLVARLKGELEMRARADAPGTCVTMSFSKLPAAL